MIVYVLRMPMGWFCCLQILFGGSFVYQTYLHVITEKGPPILLAATTMYFVCASVSFGVIAKMLSQTETKLPRRSCNVSFQDENEDDDDVNIVTTETNETKVDDSIPNCTGLRHRKNLN